MSNPFSFFPLRLRQSQTKPFIQLSIVWIRGDRLRDRAFFLQAHPKVQQAENVVGILQARTQYIISMRIEPNSRLTQVTGSLKCSSRDFFRETSISRNQQVPNADSRLFQLIQRRSGQYPDSCPFCFIQIGKHDRLRVSNALKYAAQCLVLDVDRQILLIKLVQFLFSVSSCKKPSGYEILISL